MTDVLDAIERDAAGHVEATTVVVEGGDVRLYGVVAHGLLRGRGGRGTSVAQKGAEVEKELRRLFDVRDVPAVLNDDACRSEGTRRVLRRLQGNGVLSPMHDQRRDTQSREP